MLLGYKRYWWAWIRLRGAGAAIRIDKPDSNKNKASQSVVGGDWHFGVDGGFVLVWCLSQGRHCLRSVERTPFCGRDRKQDVAVSTPNDDERDVEWIIFFGRSLCTGKVIGIGRSISKIGAVIQAATFLNPVYSSTPERLFGWYITA